MTDPIITDESEEMAVSPRDAMMEKISARVERFGNEEEPEDIIEEELSEDVPEETIKVKVNGEELEVSKDKIYDAGVRTFQKESAADKRLREAAAREAALKEREERLQKMEEELLKRKSEDVEVDDESREFAESIFTDEEKVAKHIARLKNEVREVKEKISKQEMKELDAVKKQEQEAISYYHNTYQDISTDETLHSAFNRRLKLIGEENPDFDVTQVIDEAAKQVKEKFGLEDKPSKQDIKDKLVKQPKAASQRKPPPPTEKPPTRSERLAEMRKSRVVQGY